MKTRRAARNLLFSVAALFLSACGEKGPEPTPKTAEPREVKSEKDAMSQLLKGIDWESRPHARATLFRDLLNKSSVVGELAGDTVRHSRDYEWMALIDYEPGAYFRHPVSYAFISYDEPKISLMPQQQLPTVNFKNAWANTATLLSDPNVFYDKSWLERPNIRDSASIQQDQAVDWPPKMATDRCKNEKRAFALLIHNIEDLNTSPETKQNLEAMAAALTKNGYNVQQLVADPATGERLPYLDLSGARGSGIRQLMNFINIHIDFNDCCEELIVYITGETTIEKTGYRNEVALDLPFPYSGPEQNREAAFKLYPKDIALFFDQVKTCHLNFIIDTNNAQGFSNDLLSVPNTESVLTSCRMNEYTYSSAVESLGEGKLIDPYGLSQGETGSEFTSSIVKALLEKAAERDAAAYPEPAVDLIKSGFEAVKLFDLGYLSNKSNPSLIGRTMDSNCPCGVDVKSERY